MTPQDFSTQALTGRNRRLLHEWQAMDERLQDNRCISYNITRRNTEGLPIGYLVTYHQRSICGVSKVEQLNTPGVQNRPLFADEFRMQIDIPVGYPCVDAMPQFHFLVVDNSGVEIAHPWHPNIRYFGPMAGRVCLNLPDTYADLVWAVLRVSDYLSYDLYHAVNEPPYPEDVRVAQWVLRQGEPEGWINWKE